jgi:hypothetical protein
MIIDDYQLSRIDNQGHGTLTFTLTGSSPNCFTHDMVATADGDVLRVDLFEPAVNVCFRDLRIFSMSVDFQMSEPPRQIIVSRVVTSDGYRDGEVLSEKGTYILSERALIPGDANFDGVFDSADLLSVFQSGQYADAVDDNSTWFSGDWNGDLDFDSADLVVAFQAGSYVSDPGKSASIVPEPVISVFWLPCVIGYLRRSRGCKVADVPIHTLSWSVGCPTRTWQRASKGLIPRKGATGAVLKAR